MAIVVCSIEKYCNPKHKIITEIIPNSDPKPTATTELVPATQSPDKDVLVLKANSATADLFDSDDELLAAVDMPEPKEPSKTPSNPIMSDGDDELLASVDIPSSSGKRKASPSPSRQRKTRKVEEAVVPRASTRSTRASTSKVSSTSIKPSPAKNATPKRSTRNQPSPDSVPETVVNTEPKTNTRSPMPTRNKKNLVSDDFFEPPSSEESNVPITSTQRSDPKPLVIDESEIFNSEKLKKTGSLKRKVLEADESDEEEFFALPSRKNQKLSEEKPTTETKSQKISEKQTGASQDFISRSSRALNKTESVSEFGTIGKTKSKQKLSLLENDNDEEEKFFDFGKKPAKQPKHSDDEDEEGFDFSNSRTQTKRKKGNQETPSVAGTSSSAIRPVQKKEVKKTFEYKIEPIKLTMDGWLSSSIRTLKLEDDVKKEDSIDSYPIDQKWIDSIKGNIKVEILDSTTFIRTKSFANVSNTTSNASSIGNSTLGRKNFKKFVKVSF